jgi:hypothetical protein
MGGVGTGFNCTVHGSTLYFCVIGLDGAGAAITTSTITGTMVVDAKSPATIDSTTIVVQPGDGRLHVHWNAPDATASYYVAYATPGSRNSGEVTDTQGDISGLVNLTAYEVSVAAFSVGGNPSLQAPAKADCSSTAAAQASCTPVPVDDFWTIYHRIGREQGGCGQGGAAALALLSLVPLLPRLRRRRP